MVGVESSGKANAFDENLSVRKSRPKLVSGTSCFFSYFELFGFDVDRYKLSSAVGFQLLA